MHHSVKNGVFSKLLFKKTISKRCPTNILNDSIKNSVSWKGPSKKMLFMNNLQKWPTRLENNCIIVSIKVVLKNCHLKKVLSKKIYQKMALNITQSRKFKKNLIKKRSENNCIIVSIIVYLQNCYQKRCPTNVLNDSINNSVSWKEPCKKICFLWISFEKWPTRLGNNWFLKIDI